MAQSSTLAPSESGSDPLSIGPLTFISRECPSKLDLGGGEQLTVETKITGGTKILQTFGAFYKNVRFSGTFWEDAGANYATLDTLRMSGQEQIVSWGPMGRFYGVIVELTPGIRNRYRYDFEIEINITRLAGSASKSNATSIDTVITQASTNAASAYSSVTAIDPNAATAIPPNLLSGVNASLLAASPLAASVGSSASAAVLTAVAAASAAVNAYLGTLTSLSPSYPAAAALANALTLISRNVAQGQSPRVTQQLGGSFFEAAVAAFGDISLAFPLADANNATAMRISDSVLSTIVLPPLVSSNS